MSADERSMLVAAACLAEADERDARLDAVESLCDRHQGAGYGWVEVAAVRRAARGESGE